MKVRFVKTPAQIRALWIMRVAAPITWVFCLVLSVLDLFYGNVAGGVLLAICGALNCFLTYVEWFVLKIE